jgi:ribosomal protein S19E (S16A)
VTNTLKKKDQFVNVPLWFATAAAKATKTLALLVCVYLLYASWKARSMTFTMPNGWLEERGVSREVKRRVLRDLEEAGLITIERPSRKTPIVTLVVL